MSASSSCLAIINCGQLVTLAGPARPRLRDELKQLSIISAGGMLIRDGCIEAVGAQSDIKCGITSDFQVIDAGGNVVMPGFVDAHTHPVFAGERLDEYELRATGASYEEIAAAGGGIRSTVRKTRQASEDELFEVGNRHLDWFHRCGTTTAEGKSGYGLTPQDETKILRVLGRLGYIQTFLGAHEIPDEYRGHVEAYVETIVHDMLPAIREQHLAKYCDIFCEPSVFDIKASRKILTRAKEMGFGLRMHADQLTRSGAAELAAEMGAVTADHLEQIDAQGLDALASARVQPVLLPASVYNLGRNKFPPARQMIDRGLGIVLATDFNPGSSPTPSIPFVLSLASTHMQMTPAEAICASTINAAYSVGLGEEVGSLEPGKRADFAIHDCRDYREIAYFVGVSSPISVFISGEAVYERAS